MDTFSSRILAIIASKWLTFPGLDNQAILDRVVPIAEESIMMRLVGEQLSPDDQVLFRDAYLSAPDVFDPVEFLMDMIPEFDTLVDRYFDEWCNTFQQGL
jgi:hypothetical protein